MNDAPAATPVILDSSALVALMSEDDADHDKAARIAAALQRDGRFLLIPPAVLAETLNILGKRFGRAFAHARGAQIIADPALHIPELTGDVIAPALALWKTQGGGVSYTDCLVMATADYLQTKEVFGFDAAFAKNGYHLPGEGEAG